MPNHPTPTPKHPESSLRPLVQAMTLALSGAALLPSAAQADLPQIFSTSVSVTGQTRAAIDRQNQVIPGPTVTVPASASFPAFSAKTGVLTGVTVELADANLTHAASLNAQSRTFPPFVLAGQSLVTGSTVIPSINVTPAKGPARSLVGPPSSLMNQCASPFPGSGCSTSQSAVASPNFSNAMDAAVLNDYVGEGATVTATLDEIFAENVVKPVLPGALDSAMLKDEATINGRLAITYSFLRHAESKLKLTPDIGTVLQGANPSPGKWALTNTGALPNVGLDITGISTTSADAARFDIGLGSTLPTNLAAGKSLSFEAIVDTAQAGTYAAAFQLQLADSAVGAANSRYNYTQNLNFSAKVVPRTPVLQALTAMPGYQPAVPLIADLNQDGRPELLALDRDNHRLIVQIGNARGGFDNKIWSKVAVGQNPVALAIGDVDGDGLIDAVVANYADNTVSILKGIGNGYFRRFGEIPAGSGPMAVALNDLNNDGKLDLIVADTVDKQVRTQLGNGKGAFGAVKVFAMGDLAYGLAVADLNRDGKPDVVVTHPTANSVNVLLGNGDGTLQANRPFAVGAGPLAATVTDLDSDGLPDLVVVNHGDSSLSLLSGNGTADLFAPVVTQPLPAGSGPSAIIPTDLNRDGHPDLVIANLSGNSLSVLTNQGQGGFGAALTIPVGPQPTGLAAADINRNGKVDVVSTNQGDNSLSVLTNTTDVAPAGRFVPAAGGPVAVGNAPADLVLADFNRDGKLDIAVKTANDFQFSVALGTRQGGFGMAKPSEIVTKPQFLLPGDINNDGIIDLIGPSRSGPYITYLLGRGDGSFSLGMTLPSGTTAFDTLALGDINRDGKLDFVAAHPSNVNPKASEVLVYLGDGTGNFQTPTGFTRGALIGDMHLADLNGDGKLDLTLTHRANGNLELSLGNGDGRFAPASAYATGLLYVSRHLVADINRDGKADILINGNIDPNSSGISVLLGRGNGSFQTPLMLASGPVDWFSLGSLIPADMDGDGNLDVVIADPSTNQVAVLRGLGIGELAPPQFLPVGKFPIALAVGDINGDGRVDFATANFGEDTVSVLLNRAPK